MAVLRDELTADAVVTFGAGNHAIWPARYLPHRVPGSLLAPRNGAMGMGIPAAVAASLVDPEREVVSIAGDGCFLMNGQEIATAVGARRPVRGARRRQRGLRDDPGAPGAPVPRAPVGHAPREPRLRCARPLVRGFGATVTSPASFRDAYREARASGLPAVLHLRQDPDARAPRTDATEEHR